MPGRSSEDRLTIRLAQAVEQLLMDWYAASEAAVERHRNDPEFMAMIREKSTALRTA